MSNKWYFAHNQEKAEIIFGDRPKTHWDGGPWSCVMGGQESEEELRKAHKIQEEPCRKCGRIFEASFSDECRIPMLAKNFCFTCNFWSDYVEKRDDPRIARIQGTHYYANDKIDPLPVQRGGIGHGGRLFRIRWHDGREMETNDLWHQGTIPQWWRDELPDNAEFLNLPDPVGHGQGYLGGIR